MILCHSLNTAWPKEGLLSRAYQLRCGKNRVLTPSRALQSQFDLDRVKRQIRHDTAERIPMHAKFSRSLALVAFVVAQHFLNITTAKLANSLLVSDTAGVHLYDKIIQFAFHADLSYPSS